MKVEYGMYRHTHMHNLVYSIGYDVLSFCLGMFSFFLVLLLMVQGFIIYGSKFHLLGFLKDNF